MESVTEMPGTGTADPVPATATATDKAAGSLLGISKESDDAVAAVGEKSTVTVQVCAGKGIGVSVARAPTQLLTRKLNGAASGFSPPMVPITSGLSPALLTVIVWLAGAPIVTMPNA